MAEKTTRKVRWLEMFPDEIEAAIAACPVCLMPFGLAEPHGPYNALGLDYLKANTLLERSAREHGGVVGPPFAWHVQERPEFDWLGHNGIGQNYCSGIPSDLWLKMVLYQIRAFDARGFHAALLITGHYGGLEHDMRFLCEFYTRATQSPLRLKAFADWELIRFEDFKGDHAGVVETSQLMALHPDCVDLERTPENSPFGRFAGSSFPNKKGQTPSRELGENIVRSQIEMLGETQKSLLSAYQAKKNWVAPNLNQVEELWCRFERLTRKYWWLSRSLEEYLKGDVVPFPGWEELGL